MVVNNFIAKLNKEIFYRVGYADDIAILISGNHMKTPCEITQAALQKYLLPKLLTQN